MPTYIVFKIATGEIETGRLDCPENLLDANVSARGAGYTAVLGDADDATEMIDLASVTKVTRPILSVTHNGLEKNVGDIFRVDGIPIGSQVMIVGAVISVNDGFVEWRSMKAGNYPIFITKFPYQLVKLNVTYS